MTGFETTGKKWGLEIEDWQSKMSSDFTFVLAFIFAVILSISLKVAFLLMIALFVFCAIFEDGGYGFVMFYHIIRFPGAYLHHHFKDPFKEEL